MQDRTSPSTPRLVPQMDGLPIYARGYVVADAKQPHRISAGGHGHEEERAFVYEPKDSLVFDTETTTDHRQSLRVGAYQLRTGGKLKEGLFFDKRNISRADLRTIRTYACAHGFRLLTVREFVDFIVYCEAYQTGMGIIGFNLPFDLSRIALESATARSLSDAFTLKLSDHASNPRLQIKNISSKMALIKFVALGDGGKNSTKWRGNPKAPREGVFIDVKTVASALYGPKSFSLEQLCIFLDTKTKKVASDEHGGPITPEYLDYLRNDVQATWECHEKLKAAYRVHGLHQTPLQRVYSEASIGKAYFKEMGIRPWLEVQPDFPPPLIGKLMSGYFGGRAEVHIRREIVRVLYADFASMYPTICRLMGLWQHMTAQGDNFHDSTTATRALLAQVKPDDLQNPTAWRSLCTLVEVLPDGDILPSRAKFGEDLNTVIGLNYLHSQKPLWYTLADCIASKFLTGQIPKIIRAITFTPRDQQMGLMPIDFAGNPEYRVDPRTDDLFKRVIEFRNDIKSMPKEDQTNLLKAVEKAAKQLANSAGYGMNIESNVENLSDPIGAMLFGIDHDPCPLSVKQRERPGRYFHPLLGVMITGGARLMLALAETLATSKGIDWALCDTDSMALARPEGMEDSTFVAKALEIVNWFQRLNPYEGNHPLFKLEAHNFPLDGKSRDPLIEPLYCLAISPKRYVFFNIDPKGQITLRKLSSHGLGHLLSPYEESQSPASIPKPKIDLKEEGIPQWHHDLWFRIVEAHMRWQANGYQGEVVVDYSDIPGFDQPAVSRYTASTPRLLNWFKDENEGKIFNEKVKPSNFLYSYHPKDRLAEEFDFGVIVSGRGSMSKPAKRKIPHAVSPYDKDRRKASKLIFDRITGKPVPVRLLQTYAEALADYHLNPEGKFLNGGIHDRGKTERRHIEVLSVIYIGKEADRLEEAVHLGADTKVEYGSADNEQRLLLTRVKAAIKQYGRTALATACGMSSSHFSAVVSGANTMTPSTRVRLAKAIERLEGDATDEARLVELARQESDRIGLRCLARELNIDPSNLSKTLTPKFGRKPPKALLVKLGAKFGM